MATLPELLTAPDRRERVVDDLVQLIDDEMRRKKGLRVMPLKAGYKLVKGFRPGFVRGCADYLLNEFSAALDPFYQSWASKPEGSRPPLVDELRREEDRVAEALLAVTDGRAERSQHKVIKKAYFKLRGIAKGHVIQALPGTARMIQPYLTAPA